MSNNVVKITEEQFWDQFKPIKNHLDGNASFNGCMFETYKNELEAVQKAAEATPLNVWTILDCDGKLIITAGYHFVNRTGYLITEEPALPGIEYIIKGDEDEVINDGDIESVSSIMMQDIVGDYDTPDEIDEWKWVQENASFQHVRNGQDGVHEFALNMSRQFENVPDSLAPYIAEAKTKRIAYLIFHQGT